MTTQMRREEKARQRFEYVGVPYVLALEGESFYVDTYKVHRHQFTYILKRVNLGGMYLMQLESPHEISDYDVEWISRRYYREQHSVEFIARWSEEEPYSANGRRFFTEWFIHRDD
jgi:hypothetical protein